VGSDAAEEAQDPCLVPPLLLPVREFCRVQGWELAGEFVDRASATDLRGGRAWRPLSMLRPSAGSI
jgi:hypothetical protein